MFAYLCTLCLIYRGVTHKTSVNSKTAQQYNFTIVFNQSFQNYILSKNKLKVANSSHLFTEKVFQ